MAAVLEDRTAVFGGRTYDLRYSHTALMALQMTGNTPQALMTSLMGKIGANGLQGEIPDATAAILIWAGQKWRDPKLTPVKAQKRLQTMQDVERRLLVTWAVADFLSACMGLLEAQAAKLVTPEVDDDD